MEINMSVECVNLAITDRCNRKCPECCCDVPKIKINWDINMAEIIHAANYLYGIKRLTLTGGEPSLHPDFETIVPQLKKMFGCKYLEIESNGMVAEKIPILKHFDVVAVTRYSPPEFIDSNDEMIKKLESGKFNLKIDPLPIKHVSRTSRGKRACLRGSGETVAVYKNRVYPCCMGWGIKESKFVILSESWKLDVMKLPRPCSNCFFSEE